MRTLLFAFVIAGLMAIWSAPASAVTLVNNGGPAYTFGAFSDTANGDQWQAYNDFTLTSAATITGMEWWGGYFSFASVNNPITDAFDYIIATDSGGGQPGATVASGSLNSLTRTDTGSEDAAGMEVYDYTAAPSPVISLAAGQYYLDIYDTVSNPTGEFFTWELSAAGVGTAEWSYSPIAGGWDDNSPDQLAFNLTGDAVVPEPATMTLLGLGLAGLVAKVARRKNR
jgi:hypothetical protein